VAAWRGTDGQRVEGGLPMQQQIGHQALLRVDRLTEGCAWELDVYADVDGTTGGQAGGAAEVVGAGPGWQGVEGRGGGRRGTAKGGT
jgi:hypothetical protein